MVVEYLKKNNNFGMRIDISREDDVLLDTGGGLKQAAWFFLQDRQPSEPFLLHNVDVISAIDFARMLQFHRDNDALATMATQQRETSRHLLFDEGGRLCGRQTGANPPEVVRPSQQLTALAFSGIHIISPQLLSLITEQGVFSIVATYLRLAAEGHRILAFPADDYYWRDLGKPENMVQVSADIERGLLVL
jgi:NDP-sugar pyrophosphorylase family protein